MVQPYFNRAESRMKGLKATTIMPVNYKPPFPINNDNPKIFLDIAVNLEPLGRVVIELKADTCPKTAENLRSMVEYKVLKGTYFHTIFPEFMIQAGDIFIRDPWVCPEDGSGECFDLGLVEYTQGGRSIYGECFEDENFDLPNKLGAISMINRGAPDTNGSQFFICTGDATHLDGENVAFGQVLEGFDVINAVGGLGEPEDGKPIKKVVIEDCGVLGGATTAAAGGAGGRRAAPAGCLAGPRRAATAAAAAAAAAAPRSAFLGSGALARGVRSSVRAAPRAKAAAAAAGVRVRGTPLARGAALPTRVLAGVV